MSTLNAVAQLRDGSLDVSAAALAVVAIPRFRLRVPSALPVALVAAIVLGLLAAAAVVVSVVASVAAVAAAIAADSRVETGLRWALADVGRAAVWATRAAAALAAAIAMALALRVRACLTHQPVPVGAEAAEVGSRVALVGSREDSRVATQAGADTSADMVGMEETVETATVGTAATAIVETVGIVETVETVAIAAVDSNAVIVEETGMVVTVRTAVEEGMADATVQGTADASVVDATTGATTDTSASGHTTTAGMTVAIGTAEGFRDCKFSPASVWSGMIPSSLNSGGAKHRYTFHISFVASSLNQQKVVSLSTRPVATRTHAPYHTAFFYGEVKAFYKSIQSGLFRCGML